MKDSIKKNMGKILILGTVAFFTILYFSLIFNKNVWTDEVFTFDLLRYDLRGIVEKTAEDVHPPLYYFYAKIFELISPQNIQIQKIAAILPMAAILVYMGVVIKKEFGEAQAFLSILFLACLPCTMEFAVQIRMYSLALFFVTLAGIEAYRAYIHEDIKHWIFMGIGVLGAAYTHYFAFVSVCFVMFFLLVAILISKKKLVKKWLICSLVLLIGYTPWLPSFVKQYTSVRESYWIPPITGEVLKSYITWTFGLELVKGAEIAYLILLTIVFVWACMGIKKKGIRFAILCMLVPTATTVSGVLISLTKSPIYRDQYVLPALGLLATYVGIVCADKLKSKAKYLVVLFVLFMLFSGAVQYKECFRQEYKSSYIDKTMEFFEDNLGENDYVIYNYRAMGFVYKFYFPEDRLIYVEDFDLSSDYDNAWFLYTLNNWPVTENDCINYNLGMEYLGVYGIEHNDFDLYRIYHN